MFKSILVGVDRDGGGRDAIALAKKLLDALAGYVRPRVFRRGAHLAQDATRARPGQDRRATRDGKQGGRCPSCAAVARVALGRTRTAELAEATDADLLVVGSSRRGLLDRVLLGDDTHAALDGAPCAIAVAPAGYAERPAAIREIGVAYNGSPRASMPCTAVEDAGRQSANAKPSALRPRRVGLYARRGWGTGSPRNQRARGGCRERIAALGGVGAHASYGVPAEELSLYSASLDLMVVGSRGYGPIRRLVHGSISQQLARTARCPLLVLTRAARTAEEPETSEGA